MINGFHYYAIDLTCLLILFYSSLFFFHLCINSFLRLSVTIFEVANYSIFYTNVVTVVCLNCKLAFKGIQVRSFLYGKEKYIYCTWKMWYQWSPFMDLLRWYQLDTLERMSFLLTTHTIVEAVWIWNQRVPSILNEIKIKWENV